MTDMSMEPLCPGSEEEVHPPLASEFYTAPRVDLGQIYLPRHMDAELLDTLSRPFQDARCEELRGVVLRKRNAVIAGCVMQIVMSVVSISLYAVRETLLVPIGSAFISCMALCGFKGAARLKTPLILLHGVVTSGVLLAVILYSTMETLFGKVDSATTLPDGVILLLFCIPYGVDLVVSVWALQLGDALMELGRRMGDQDRANVDPLHGPWGDPNQPSCCVCMDRPQNTALIPCGHKVVCFPCSQNFPGRPCPVCRRRVDTVTRIWD